MTKIKQMSNEVMSEVSKGKSSTKEGASFANEVRNKILIETRKSTTPVGLSFVEKIKKAGPTLENLMDKYASDLFHRKKFSALNEPEKKRFITK